MSKKDVKFYICLHEPCIFKTDKRKAIYTHLVRTHNERKEDYECEYCNKVFERDSEIEDHLLVHHPQQAFTYTCVSRIENVINTCARLGSDSKSPKKKSISPASESPSTQKSSAANDDVTKDIRTKASVNASLNSIAKTVKPDNIIEEVDEENDNDIDEIDSELDEEIEEGSDDEDAPTYVSEPSGLKIKLSLKKPKDNSSVESESEVASPPLLVQNSVHNTRFRGVPKPKSSPSTAGNVQVRDKASKYYDKLEVYHTTDSLGRRCCPFCDYKTTKNTIRVHLSGIHKIHFVKCSLCDYKAAFPHQITQHGLKFHKTTNLNVIQLSKEFRERIIEQLKYRLNLSGGQASSNGVEMIVDDEDFNSEESYASSEETPEPEVMHEPADDRVFKAPVCQTSKTDYYRIQYENGVYLYSCNLCSFKTPVRATIYTHKYRHEEKVYQCGYCDFTAAPRYTLAIIYWFVFVSQKYLMIKLKLTSFKLKLYQIYHKIYHNQE